MRGYRLPPLPPGGLLPRPPPLGLPVVAGALGGLDEPLAIGILLAMEWEVNPLAHPVRYAAHGGDSMRRGVLAGREQRFTQGIKVS